MDLCLLENLVKKWDLMKFLEINRLVFLVILLIMRLLLEGSLLIFIMFLLIWDLCIIIFLLVIIFLLYLVINLVCVEGWWNLVVMRMWICVFGVIECKCWSKIGVMMCEGMGWVWLELIIMIFFFFVVNFFREGLLIGLFNDCLIKFFLERLVW